MTEDRVNAIVEGIIDDLTDRKALRHVWDNIDDDTQGEIRDTWRDIVRKNSGGA